MGDVDEAIDRLTFGAGRLEAPTPVAPLPDPLFRSVLVGVDPSHGAEQAIQWARALGSPGRSEVHLVHVLPSPRIFGLYGLAERPGMPEGPAEMLERAGTELLARTKERLRPSAATVEGHIEEGSPVAGILRVAERVRPDLVILGATSGGRLARLLLGSVAEGVTGNTRASVLLARTAPPPERILAATDGSRSARVAVDAALRLSSRWAAKPTVLHVVEPQYFLYPEAEARRRLDQVLADVKGAGRPVADYEIDLGPPAERIVDHATSQKAGLIVVGSRGLGGLRSLVSGSVSTGVARRASASVLVVKG
ncbi:MAG: universal stress protein [Methanobacteriota archaeon]